MADYDIFREQLLNRYYTYGHALWEPSPSKPNDPVKVGDIGYIRSGRFYRLFNALLPAKDQSNVPKDHEQLTPKRSDHIIRGSLSSDHYCSAGISVEREPDFHASSPDDLPKVSFSNARRRGAILSLPLDARREDTQAIGDFREWIVKHIDSWFTFARELGLGIERMEEIILVTGCDHTRSWTNVAFFGDQYNAQVSFGVEVNHGPPFTVNWQPLPERVRGAVVHRGPGGRNLPEDQCVFIRGFRVSRTFWKLPRRLKAAAGPSPDQGGYDYDPDTEVIPIPANTKYRDPLYLLQDYIAERAPDCDMTLVHDKDLVKIYESCHDALAEIHEPEMMMDHLRKSNMAIHEVSYDSSSSSNNGPNTERSIVNVAMVSLTSQNWNAVSPSQWSSVVSQNIDTGSTSKLSRWGSPTLPGSLPVPTIQEDMNENESTSPADDGERALFAQQDVANSPLRRTGHAFKNILLRFGKPTPTAIVHDSGSASATTSSSRMIALDPIEFSTTTTLVDPEAIVGGGDTQYTRKQLRLINNLHDIGLDNDIPLPMIALIGSQSSGKSSLIHAISGVPLPKAPGDACTRCPIECRLMRGETWSCRVFLRRVSNSSDVSSSEQTKEPFGDDITVMKLVKNRVERAQLAILNPSLPAESFLDADIDLEAPPESSFSSSIICLEITGPEYSDISFIDLPGLIRNVGTSGNRSDIQLIENLAGTYISKPNCLILMTITCETDFANQGAYGLAHDHDPKGLRTVGVLTKPDRTPDASHGKWVKFINGETEPLHHGWFCVKLHDTEAERQQSTLADAREQEDEWFNKTPAWRGLRQARSHLGTKRLVQRLEEILSELITTRLVDLNLQIRELEEKTASELESLGKPPSDDSIGEINALIDRLVYDIERGTERRGREHGNLLYLIEDEAVTLKKKLRETCPEFRPWRKDKQPESFTSIPDIFLEEGDPPADPETREIIYLDDVISKKTRSSARGLPDSRQGEVAEEYLKSVTAQWPESTNDFIENAGDLLRTFIEEAIKARCGRLSYGGLSTHLWGVIDVHLKECLERTQDATKLLLKLERSGHTRNDRYYRKFKDKFLSHFKLHRELASQSTLLRDLNRIASPSGPQPRAPFTNQINSAISSLGKAGFSGVDVLQLAKLLPSQSSDPALEDMAAASAGFEVALHRFVDYVPLIVDTELVQGACQDLAIVLRKSFRFSDANAAERCSEFLRESDEVRERREYLRQRKRRLASAIEELTEFGFWS